MALKRLDAVGIVALASQRIGENVVVEDVLTSLQANYLGLGAHPSIEVVMPSRLGGGGMLGRLRKGDRVAVRGRLVCDQRGQIRLRAAAAPERVARGRRPAWQEELPRLRALQAARPLPKRPREVVVLGPDGQGLDDMADILAEAGVPARFERLRNMAPAALAEALGRCAGAAPRPDLVVLARGGGAGITSTFDDEVVVRAVAACPVAVVTAIGHASDHTIADEVARRSFRTPTECAMWLRARWAGEAEEAWACSLLEEEGVEEWRELWVEKESLRLENERLRLENERLAGREAALEARLQAALLAGRARGRARRAPRPGRPPAFRGVPARPAPIGPSAGAGSLG